MFLRAALLSLALTCTGFAATIYDNFSAGDTFTNDSGFVIGKSGANIKVWGQEFTPSGSFTLDDVLLAFDAPFTPAHNDLTITVMASDTNGLPGTTVESFDVMNALGTNVIVTADSTLHPLLLGGTSYWLVAQFTNPSSGTDQALWNFSNNNAADFSISASQTNGGSWTFSNATQMSVFRVEGTPVPEASTALLVVSGLLAFSLRRLRSKRRIQRSSEPC